METRKPTLADTPPMFFCCPSNEGCKEQESVNGDMIYWHDGSPPVEGDPDIEPVKSAPPGWYCYNCYDYDDALRGVEPGITLRDFLTLYPAPAEVFFKSLWGERYVPETVSPVDSKPPPRCKKGFPPGFGKGPFE